MRCCPQGETGIQGSTGLHGIRGDMGFTGLRGFSGEVGSTGVQGLRGIRGITGLLGSTGLVGPEGPIGRRGDLGSIGLVGAQGLTGIQGKGSTGFIGSTGLIGSQGSTGSQGYTGLGLIGETGVQGLIGEAGLQGTPGIDGSQGFTGALGLKGDTGHTVTIGLVGHQGTTGLGDKGDQGIQGPQGLQGADGEVGQQGSQGDTGIQGERGRTGFTGIKGLIGETGLQGEIGEEGPRGLMGFIGPVGHQGSVGETGIQGIDGDTGYRGEKGLTGIDGIDGLKGDLGETGVQGSRGELGFTGIRGEHGLTGLKGIRGQAFKIEEFTDIDEHTLAGIESKGHINKENVYYLVVIADNRLDRDIPLPIAGNMSRHCIMWDGDLWHDFGYFTGQQGDTGILGYTGLQGIQGNTGIRGITGLAIVGATGVKGITGIFGMTGIQGNTGIRGYTGYMGRTGLQGVQGNTGTQGIQGNLGNTGIYGIQGIQGEIGVRGYQGFTGSDGLDGTDGIDGIDGDQGQKGDRGYQGFTGPQGYTGVRGITGIFGMTGVQGITGLFGMRGFTGLKGDLGETGVQGLIGQNFQVDEFTDIAEAKITSIETVSGSGATPSDVYLVVVYSDNRSNQALPAGISGDMSGNIITWDGTSWNNLGLFSGIQGEQGITGLGITGPQGDIGPSFFSYEEFDPYEYLTLGELVKIINVAGVAEVKKIVGIDTLNFIYSEDFILTGISKVSCCIDTSKNKVILSYADTLDNNKGKAVVGTIVGDTITFGAPSTFYFDQTDSITCAFDDVNNRVVIAYNATDMLNTPVEDPQGRVVAGEVIAGTSLSFGLEYSFYDGSIASLTCCFEKVFNRVAIFYKETDGAYGRYRVATINPIDNSISFELDYGIFNSDTPDSLSCCYDPSRGKIALFFRDGDVGNKGLAQMFVPISIASSTGLLDDGDNFVFSTFAADHISCCFINYSNKILVAYEDYNVSDLSRIGKAIIASPQGLGFNFGLANTFYEDEIKDSFCCYDSNNSKVIISFSDPVLGNANYVVASPEGDSVFFGNVTEYDAISPTSIVTVYDKNFERVLIVTGNSSRGYLDITSVDSPDQFVGIIQQTSTGKVALINQISNAHLGQTPGVLGYIQSDGSLGTIQTRYKVGRFLTDTKFAVTKNP